MNATFDTGEELFLRTCDSRRVGRVRVLVNTNLKMNIDLFEQLTTRIGRAIEKMCINAGHDNLRRPRSNIKLRRRGNRGLLYGLGEVLQGRPHFLQVSVVERSIERVKLGITCLTQKRAGIRSFTLRQQSNISDAAAYAKSSKIRWADYVMRLNDNHWTRAVSDRAPQNVKRTTGRPPTRWSDFFTKPFKERYDVLRVPRAGRTQWETLAPERDKWKDSWRPLGVPEDQRESR
ncbi:hypothetical protein ANCDUO_00743 [Ancylostoma duodenale]|uniref:Uncharacterized protein n=1 Tax=Ancylostoma duodenale TaxID=51022 RepID=A0A0C2H517_9BILA|nr:hypothetical protein ANCDUO_00743 [Ancylostoma duodenale]